jgi:hypothetical protein
MILILKVEHSKHSSNCDVKYTTSKKDYFSDTGGIKLVPCRVTDVKYQKPAHTGDKN